MGASANQPKVVLVWPGAMFEPSGTFGVPQMLNLAEALRRMAGAEVEIIDLDMERGYGPVDLTARCKGAVLVGISCYSSYDYLKTLQIAEQLQRTLPNTTLVTGGYHPSARPHDFTGPDSPFDYVVVGDGELPTVGLLKALLDGNPPSNRVLGPEALSSPRQVMPYDWELLSRYRPIAAQRASQAEIYLSRGCPYDCSFCMERAKRDTAWRALEPAEAVEELHRLDRFLDLSGWTLRVTDPLFGMKRAWRRAFLEELVRRPVRARKTWLLIRLDLVEEEDFSLMSRANVAPGFGLESGDPEQLRRIRKTGMLSGYLDKMMQVAQWARDYRVPFGANIIVGHPGETEQSLRTSAEYMRRLFLDPKGSYGFLSVDPFRLYPGSPIADNLDEWTASTGMFAHRYPWWEDGDQSFLSEWIDPSDELTYLRRDELTQELFAPISRGIVDNFAYTGPSRDYFQLALDREVRGFSESSRKQRLELHSLWSSLLPPRPAHTTKRLTAAAAKRSLPVIAHDQASESAEATPQQGLRSASLSVFSMEDTNVASATARVQRGPTWASAVFHTLAHVDATPHASSLWDERYQQHCEDILGSVAERALGDAARRLARAITSHAEYASLQSLAALFPEVSDSLSARGASQLERFSDLSTTAALLVETVLGELDAWSRLPRLQCDPALNAELSRMHTVSPWLPRFRVQHLDSLQVHGRLMGDAIWIGTPCRHLGVSSEQVAIQAAHEATVAEVKAEQPDLAERDVEAAALSLLARRRTALELPRTA